MEAKTIQIKVRGAAVLPLDKLEPFQGDLKRLEREEYERLRSNLIANGFSLTMHVWQNDGHNYIIDGHQRVTALKMMAENEGWIVPELPVSLVDAPDFQSAKKIVLAAVAQYGKYDEKSVFDFMQANEIPFDTFVTNFTFPDLDMDKFSAMFQVSTEAATLPPPDAPTEQSGLPSGSMGVKQLQLLFATEDYDEFQNLVGRLKNVYNTESVSDTVMGALRAAIEAFNSKQ